MAMDAAATRTEAVVTGTAWAELKLEVVIIPVSDVDRAKRFYQRLGWRIDADFSDDQGWRVVQATPPGSPCSILFGQGITTAEPGSVRGSFLVVDDVEVACAQLVARGADVTEVFHFDAGLHVTGTAGRIPGVDPERRSYRSWASFDDPDGNSWLLQEITTRLPGRGFGRSVTTLTDLLREAERRHGEYEPIAPKHHWSAWYAAYVVARERGSSVDEAVADAATHVESTPT
jgi:catechol 2,3-dioxygenase-like lactoylglutathione lyase family enzyme